MKKILLIIQMLALGALLTPANANSNIAFHHGRKNKTEVTKRHEKNNNWVSYQTAQQFAIDFPNATNVSWYEGYYSEATFKDGGVIKTAYYDQDNELVGTTRNISYSKLPLKGRKEIEKLYPDYKATLVLFSKDNPEDNSDMILYDTAFDSQDAYFVEISNGTISKVLKVDTDGNVMFLKNL